MARADPHLARRSPARAQIRLRPCAQTNLRTAVPASATRTRADCRAMSARASDPTAPRPPVTPSWRRPWGLALTLVVVAGAAAGVLPDLLGLDGRTPFAQLAAFRPVLLGGLLGRHRRRRDHRAGAAARRGARRRPRRCHGRRRRRGGTPGDCRSGRPRARRAARTHADRADVQHLRGRGRRRRRRRADPDRADPTWSRCPRPRVATGTGSPRSSREYRLRTVARARPRRPGRHGCDPARPRRGRRAGRPVDAVPVRRGDRRRRSATLGSSPSTPSPRPPATSPSGAATWPPSTAGAQTGSPARSSSLATSTPRWTTRRSARRWAPGASTRPSRPARDW